MCFIRKVILGFLPTAIACAIRRRCKDDVHRPFVNVVLHRFNAVFDVNSVEFHMQSIISHYSVLCNKEIFLKIQKSDGRLIHRKFISFIFESYSVIIHPILLHTLQIYQRFRLLHSAYSKALSYFYHIQHCRLQEDRYSYQFHILGRFY